MTNNITRRTLLGTDVDSFTFNQTVDIIIDGINSGKNIHHVCVNAAKVVAMQTNPILKKSVLNADIISPDGQSIVWASKILGKPLPERVNGTNLMEKLIHVSYKQNLKIYFLGATHEVVEKVVSRYRQEYGDKIIAGYRNGYFDKSEEALVAKQIESSGANILFVAMPTPIKENFLFINKKALKSVEFIMGVGGSFDVVSGITKRAPKWMQQCGLEWFFRLLQEPRRMFKRYLIGNTKFVLLVLKELFK